MRKLGKRQLNLQAFVDSMSLWIKGNRDKFRIKRVTRLTTVCMVLLKYPQNDRTGSRDNI